MSQPSKDTSIRSLMKPLGSSDRTHLGEPLITIDPRNLDARTNIPAIFAMATHATIAKRMSKEPEAKDIRGVTFNMHTLSGVMECWEFEYKAKAPSLDGKARQQYADLAKWVAVGQGDESGSLTTSLLTEGAKTLPGKEKK